MKEFKNLKIEVNAEQPLLEIAKELERLEYKMDFCCKGIPSAVITWGSFGIYDITDLNNNEMPAHEKTTTLSELKEM